MEVQYKRLNLKEGDNLIIEVDNVGLTEDELKNKLFELRNDEFVSFVEEKGHKVFVTHSGIKLEILRMEPNDKLVVYADVSNMTDEEEKQYLDFVKFKITANVPEEKIILLPKRNGSPALSTLQTKEEENDSKSN